MQGNGKIKRRKNIAISIKINNYNITIYQQHSLLNVQKKKMSKSNLITRLKKLIKLNPQNLMICFLLYLRKWKQKRRTKCHKLTRRKIRTKRKKRRNKKTTLRLRLNNKKNKLISKNLSNNKSFNKKLKSIKNIKKVNRNRVQKTMLKICSQHYLLCKKKRYQLRKMRKRNKNKRKKRKRKDLKSKKIMLQKICFRHYLR